MREKQRKQVREWTGKDPERYRYLLSFFDTGAEIAQISDDLIVLERKDVRIAYCAGSGVEVKRDRLLMVDSAEEKDRLLAGGGFQPEVLPAYMWYYPEKTVDVPACEGLRLRKLTVDDYDYVKRNYDAPAADQENVIENCIARGMTGAEDEDGLCGFIGVHDEGTMGFLFVQEDHRHRGIAEMLERELIRQLLEKGEYPYCHVEEHNEASLALQKKIGLKAWPDLFYWIAEEEY